MLKRYRGLAQKLWFEVAPALVVVVIVFALYLRTIAPGVLGGDAGELQFVPYILSLTHPNGYPLHTLLGKLWATLVPLGSVAFRMNLLSAVSGAAAVGVIYGAIRISTGSRLAALAAAMSLGTSQLFWEQALTADKYALAALMESLLVASVAYWSTAPAKRDLGWCAFVYGLSLTQHRSMLVFLPVLLAYWLWLDPRLRHDWRYACRVILLMAAPLLLYLWLPIGASRHLPPGSWRLASLRDWWSYLSDQGYLAQMNLVANLGSRLAFYGRTLLAQFSVVGLALAFVGAANQARSRKAFGVFVALGFALQAVLSTSYQVPRFWVFFLPSFVLFAMWVGEGLACLWSWAGALARRSRVQGYSLAGLIAITACLPAGLSLQQNYPSFRQAHLDGGSLDLWRQNLKSGYLAQRFAAYSLDAAEPDAIIVCDWEQSTPLWYLQQVEGQRRDISVFYPIERWQEALATGRPVYLARTLPGVGEPYHLTTAGPLVRIASEPATQLPADAHPINIRWQDQIALVGYRYYQNDFRAGYVLPISLYFRADGRPAADYSISLRLYREDGTQVWSEDRQNPVLGMYPTSRWSPGEIVADYFEVPFPRSVPPGRYRLGIILYTRLEGGGWRNLSLAGREEVVGYLPAIDIPARR